MSFQLPGDNVLELLRGAVLLRQEDSHVQVSTSYKQIKIFQPVYKPRNCMV